MLGECESLFEFCRHANDCEETEKKEAVYSLRGQEFRHTGTMRVETIPSSAPMQEPNLLSEVR